MVAVCQPLLNYHLFWSTTFKIKRSKVKVTWAGAYCGGLPHSLFITLLRTKATKVYSQLSQYVVSTFDPKWPWRCTKSAFRFSVFVKTPVAMAQTWSSVGVFQSLGRATANDRSPTVTSRDRGMTSSEEVDDRWDVSNAAQWIRVRQIPRCSVVKTMTTSQVLVNSDNWHAACLSLSCTPFPYSTWSYNYYEL